MLRYKGTSGHEDGGDDSEDEGVKEVVSSVRGFMTAWRPDRPPQLRPAFSSHLKVKVMLVSAQSRPMT